VECAGDILSFCPHSVEGLNGLGGGLGYQPDTLCFQLPSESLWYAHTAGVAGADDKEDGRIGQDVCDICNRQAVALPAPPVAYNRIADDFQIMGISLAGNYHVAPGGVLIDQYSR
jgi:hypothetical protein